MILSIGLALAILFEGIIAGVVVVAFLSNWQGIAGAGITLLASAVVFKTCFSATQIRPRLWFLWAVLSGVILFLVILDRLFGAAIGFHAVMGSLAIAAAGFSGSWMGRK